MPATGTIVVLLFRFAHSHTATTFVDVTKAFHEVLVATLFGAPATTVLLVSAPVTEIVCSLQGVLELIEPKVRDAVAEMWQVIAVPEARRSEVVA